MRPSSTILGLVLSASLSSSAFANTYIVDANGSGQFTDIQSAIAVAQDGDVILVHPGIYPPFLLDKGIIVIGYGNVRANGTVQVVNVNAGARAAIVNIVTDISVSGCAGPVVLQDIHDLLRTLTVSQSNDVRIARLQAWGPNGSGLDPMSADMARIEIVDSFSYGGIGADASQQDAHAGGHGFIVGPYVRLHASRSSFRGGMGGNSYLSPYHGGDGGAGMRLNAPTEVFVMSSDVEGARGGLAYWQSSHCYDDGAGACGFMGAGDVHESGSTITGAYTNQSYYCYNPQTGQDQGYVQPGFCTTANGNREMIASRNRTGVAVYGRMGE